MSESPRCALSVVIPAFNEAGRLPKTLEALDLFFRDAEHLGPAEIIVVDDGSTDQTFAVAGGFRFSGAADLRILRHEYNRGKGAAVRTGFGCSKGQLVLLSDADLAAPITGLSLLLPESTDSAVVIGSRAIDRSLLLTPQPLYRDLMGRTFNLLVRSLLLPRIYDTQCGFKLFPGGLARSLASVQKTDGFAYDVELLALSVSWGFTIVEVGVPWGHVEASRVLPGRHSVQMFRDLLRIAVRRWTRTLCGDPRDDGSHA